MKDLSCAAVRRRLEAYHDREIAVADEIAVGAHLAWCGPCAAALADLDDIRETLLAYAPSRECRHALLHDEGAVFTAAAVNRAKAERDWSFLARVRATFEDMRPVYAGFGSAAATMVCVIVMLSMMRFATSERPDSLAGMVNVLATPLECDSGNDFTDASGCRARWDARVQRANADAEQAALFELEAAIVTRNGHLATPASLRAQRRHRESDVIDAMLDALSRSRIDGQSPQPSSSTNRIWLVEHATVRATKQPALDLQLPPAKKRAEIPSRNAVRA